jgi:hypothetical protein
LAVGVVGAVGAGTAAYASSQQQKQALGGLANQGYTAPDYGDTQSYLSSNYYLPQYQDYKPTPYTTGYDQYLATGNKYAGKISNFLEKTNDKSNAQYRHDLYSVSPTLAGNLGQQGANTASFLRGEIPADVQTQVRNNAAETSLYGGFGGSQMARNLTARDFGLTSLNLIDKGNAGLSQQLGYSQALNPFQSNTLDYIQNPGQFQQQAIQQNQYGNQVTNANQTNYASVANQRATAIANLMKAQADANAGATNTNNVLQYQAAAAPNPLYSGLSTGLGSLSASYGAGGGAGGNNYSGLIQSLTRLLGGNGGANPESGGGYGEYASPAYL